jgi:hypothetical protein
MHLGVTHMHLSLQLDTLDTNQAARPETGPTGRVLPMEMVAVLEMVVIWGD